MARLPELRGSVCGKKLGRLEEFGRGLGALGVTSTSSSLKVKGAGKGE